jgi:cell division protein FtsQ
VTLLLTALLISLGALLWVYTGTGVLNVRKVEVRGNMALDASYLRALSGIGDDTHILKMNVKAVEEALRSEPYVAGVCVKRRFPDTVILDVEERVPEGFFLQNGKYFSIDRQGVVLASSEQRPQGLLEIRGVEVPLLYPGQEIKGDNFSEVAELVAGLPDELRGMIGAAGYRPQCGLYLESGGTTIIYKDCNDLDRKNTIALLALRELVGHYHGVEYIDVSFPDHPVIKPL